ncbi:MULTISPECIES: hypothetical protein [Microbacterium]|uniref:hypothetical protein n=1 Tax=Microbacterium TaxID=33882 RepID=UPI00146A7AF6|nr:MULTISPECIES: hypothetical protein [Microbacterium]
MSAQTGRVGAGGAKRAWSWAWWSLILYPFSIVIAFIAGEGVPASVGYSDGVAAVPWWIAAIALVVATAVLAMPLLLTAHFSRKAAALGQPGAWVPLIIGGLVVAGFILMNLVSGALVAVFG